MITSLLTKITEFTVAVCGGGGPFFVAPECSGIRSLPVIMLLSTLDAILSTKKISASIRTLILSIPIAIICNQIRVAILVISHPYLSSAFWFHLHAYLGYLTFLLALFLIHKTTLFKT